MIRFIIRRLFLMTLTVLLVSVLVFAITESSPGNIAKNVLGAFITPEQEQSFLKQLGMDKPASVRYIFWLIGSDWYASQKIDLPLERTTTDMGFEEWWAKEDGKLKQWVMEDGVLLTIVKGKNGKKVKTEPEERWQTDKKTGINFFWGLDRQNRVVKWEKKTNKTSWNFKENVGWQQSSGAPTQFIPLRKGFLRGDPGISLRTGRPVAPPLMTCLRNSTILAGLAFVIIMPIALALGILAGLNEGSLIDRILSIGGMMFSVIPEFVTGIILILIFSVWFPIFPGASVFGDASPWSRPDMLVLPVLTLTLIELGYILRISRASMSETIEAPYIRTAFLKGLSYKRVVLDHALKNAMIAPITVIMLHVTWLLGGIVIVEAVFGYPGLGKFILEATLYKDVNALEAGSVILVIIAVITQLIADIIYTMLNPRIRFE